MNEAEQAVRDAEKRALEALEDARAAKLEATEMIAAFGGGGGGGGGGASTAELEKAQDDLDAAQEEVVMLTERCDALNEALRIAHQKIEVYEQMVVAANNNAKARVEQMQVALQGSDPFCVLPLTAYGICCVVVSVVVCGCGRRRRSRHWGA